MTGGGWMIGPDPVSDSGYVATLEPDTGDLLPHQISEWRYVDDNGEWQTDPLLTVTGKSY